MVFLVAGSIPQLYERYLVPLIFEPDAQDISRQVQECRPAAMLELAAGTGALTRELARRLPPEVSIIATDLSQPMLDEALTVGTSRPVEWRQTDAMQLPFPDQSFDIVVCQFGVMFFREKSAAFAEAKRALRPGGSGQSAMHLTHSFPTTLRGSCTVGPWLRGQGCDRWRFGKSGFY